MTAASATGAPQSVPAPPDDSPSTPVNARVRNMATRDELAELLESLRPGKNLRHDFTENRWIVYGWLVRRYRAGQHTGKRQHTFTWAQLAWDFYDDVERGNVDKAHARIGGLRPMLKDLAAVGVIEWGPLCSAQGRLGANGTRQRGGKYQCLWFELRDVDAALVAVRSGAPAGIAQSVRATPGKRLRAVPETRSERRARHHRAYARTGGHRRPGGVEQSGFMRREGAAFFGPAENLQSGGCGPLKGAHTQTQAALAEQTPATPRPGGSSAAAPRPAGSAGRDRAPSALDLALRGALTGVQPQPAGVSRSDDGPGDPQCPRLSIALRGVWAEEIGPAPALPAALADRLDRAADAFDRLRDPHRWQHGAADAAHWKAIRPLLHHPTPVVKSPDPLGTSADRAGSGLSPRGENRGRSTGTRGAAEPEPSRQPAAAVPQPTPLERYAAAVVSELEMAAEKHAAWRRRRDHEMRRNRR